MSGMKRWLALGVSALAAFWLVPTHASASTLTDCLAQQHVCVASDGRSLISQSQEADLERQIGGDPIYLVVAASGSSGYDSAMNQIISALGGHERGLGWHGYGWRGQGGDLRARYGLRPGYSLRPGGDVRGRGPRRRCYRAKRGRGDGRTWLRPPRVH